MKLLHKKSFFVALMVIFISVAVAACGGEPPPASPSPTYYTIKKAETTNGSFTLSHGTAVKDTVIIVNPLPDDGYHVSAMYFMRTNSSTQTSPDNIRNNQFAMPDYDVTVTVSFAENAHEYLITKAETENGVFEVDKTVAAAGDTVNIAAEPDEGFAVGTISIKKADNQSLGVTVSDSRFSMPEYDVIVSVTFIELNEHTVTHQQPDNGMIIVNKNTAVFGEEVAITVTPADGYVFGSLTVASVGGTAVQVTKSESAENVYKFIMPNVNVTIGASFKKLYSVNIAPTDNGSVLCDIKKDVADSHIEFRVVPHSGWVIDTVAVADANENLINVSRESTNLYTFTLPKSDVTIFVTFKQVDYFVRLFFESPTETGQYAENYEDFFGSGSGYVSGKGFRYSALKEANVSTFTPEIYSLIESVNNAVRGDGYVYYCDHPQNASFGIVLDTEILTLRFYWTKTVEIPEYQITVLPFNGGSISIKSSAYYGETVIFTVNTDEGWLCDDDIQIWKTDEPSKSVPVYPYRFGNTVCYYFIMRDNASQFYNITIKANLVRID